jgi:hypothetical protein
MLSKYDQYSDAFSRCMTNAKCRNGDARAIWLNLADSYRMLLHDERKYPRPVGVGSDQMYKSESATA